MGESESGPYTAGWILVLIGATLTFAVTFALAIAASNFLMPSGPDSEARIAEVLIGSMFAFISLITLAGGIVGIAAYHAARAGDVRGAWVRGLVAAFLPPLQPLTLVGAILLRVSPEYKTWKAQHA